MVFIDDHNRNKADLDGYGKKTITKKEFEEIVKEEKEMGGLITRAMLKKMYNIKK
ncbi:MAG TPA: hypothetical protein VI977_05600 [archaeon]|nr:hypothetical protein [archaeon]